MDTDLKRARIHHQSSAQTPGDLSNEHHAPKSPFGLEQKWGEEAFPPPHTQGCWHSALPVKGGGAFQFHHLPSLVSCTHLGEMLPMGIHAWPAIGKWLQVYFQQGCSHCMLPRMGGKDLGGSPFTVLRGACGLEVAGM